MALQINYARNGVDLPTAYLRVVSVPQQRNSDRTLVIFEVYVDVGIASAGGAHFDHGSRVFDYDPLANIPVGYTLLKTLPEFAGAVDV